VVIGIFNLGFLAILTDIILEINQAYSYVPENAIDRPEGKYKDQTKKHV